MKILKLINNLCIILSILIGITFGCKYLFDGNIVRVLTSLSVIPLILLPKIVKKSFKIEINIWIETMFIVFIFFAQTLGTIVSLYYYFKGYDKIMHTISGVVTSFLALYLLVKLNIFNKKNILFNIIFIISVTLSVAAIWEIFEYTADQIFNIDVQWVKKTGVTDTMTDIIVALFGSIFFCVLYLYEQLNKTKFIITNYIESITKR